MELRHRFDDEDVAEGETVKCRPIAVTYFPKGGGKVSRFYYSIEELTDEWEDV